MPVRKPVQIKGSRGLCLVGASVLELVYLRWRYSGGMNARGELRATAIGVGE